jgi:hypothetical protein
MMVRRRQTFVKEVSMVSRYPELLMKRVPESGDSPEKSSKNAETSEADAALVDLLYSKEDTSLPKSRRLTLTPPHLIALSVLPASAARIAPPSTGNFQSSTTYNRNSHETVYFSSKVSLRRNESMLNKAALKRLHMVNLLARSTWLSPCFSHVS